MWGTMDSKKFRMSFEDDDSGPAGYGEGDFIRLDDGKCFIKKYEIVGMKWERYAQHEGSEPRSAESSYLGQKYTMAWQLRVFFSDCPSMIAHGEEAADIMRSFGLPEEPPL